MTAVSREPLGVPGDLEELLAVLTGEGGHRRRPRLIVPAPEDEPLLLEPLERRTDRGAAHAETLRHVRRR